MNTYLIHTSNTTVKDKYYNDYYLRFIAGETEV